jgi:glutamyl/glutaminyl-tRNA synthetase
MIQEGEFTYLNDTITYPAEALVWKKSTAEMTLRHLEKLSELLDSEVQWNLDNVKSLIWEYAEEQGKGDVLWPMRYALSGREKSPDPITLAVIIGKEKTLERIRNATQLVSTL